jgi:ribosomal protein S8
VKNINQIMKALEKKGFVIEYGNGSIAKIYPFAHSQLFYSLHIGERAIHPLKRFAKKKWNLDIKDL